MNVRPMLIQLTFLGETVASVRTEDLSEPILIGRDEAAAWRAPERDRTMPARAAVLRLKGGVPHLKAEPGASFRVNGETVRDRVLKVGDRVAVGDCELSLASVSARHLYARWHRLEELGGERKGSFIDVKAEAFRIGTAETADLRLRDDTVSRRHATLFLRGEECWVHDESSRNGTRVNGQRLGGKDRLLMDGDVLAFGPFEYRFLDRSVLHVRATPVKNVLIVLATLLIAGGGWYAFYQRTPDVSQYFLTASNFAAEERFDEAERMMREARTARNFAASETIWRRHRERLSVWIETWSAWSEFRQNLQKGRIHAACAQIGLLSLEKKTDWDWDSSTVDSRMAEVREAVALAQLAYGLWCAQNDSELTEAARTKIERERTRLGVDRAGFAADGRPWMKGVKDAVTERARLYDANEGLYAQLTNGLARLTNDAKISLADATNDVERVRCAATGHVRLFAHMLKEPLAKLAVDQTRLRADAKALSALDGSAYSGVALVTTPDDCALSPSLGACLENFVRERRELDLASLELYAMKGRLARFGSDGFTVPPSLLVFEDTNRVERAMLCKLLDAARPPKPTRTEPVDEDYDRLFGYEFLHSYMVEGYYAFPKEIDETKLADTGFSCELRTLFSLWEELDADLKLLKGREFERIRSGRCAALEARFADWRARIRAIRDRFDAVADDSATINTRRGIIARAACLYLTPHAEIRQEDWDDFRKRMVWQRDSVTRKVEEFNPTKPVEARRIVDWIMANGVPGSPAVRKAWNYRK